MRKAGADRPDDNMVRVRPGIRGSSTRVRPPAAELSSGMHLAVTLLLASPLAMARDLVLIGERYAPASHVAWPGILERCLDQDAPGVTLVDRTSPEPSLAHLRRSLEGLPEDAVVVVAMAPPGLLGRLDRLHWRHALRVVLARADEGERDALLFGPWPAFRRRVRAEGSVPASAVGYSVEVPEWSAAGVVAARAGVSQVDWRGPEPPPQGYGITDPGTWADIPSLGPASLGEIACRAVLPVLTARPSAPPTTRRAGTPPPARGNPESTPRARW